MFEFGRAKTEFQYNDVSYEECMAQKRGKNIEFWKDFFSKQYPNGLFVETDEPIRIYKSIPLPESEWYWYKNRILVKAKTIVVDEKVSNTFFVKDNCLVSECGSFEITLAHIGIPETDPREFITGMLKKILINNGD